MAIFQLLSTRDILIFTCEKTNLAILKFSGFDGRLHDLKHTYISTECTYVYIYAHASVYECVFVCFRSRGREANELQKEKKRGS